MSRLAAAIAALAAPFAFACDRSPGWPPSPAALRAGEDVCAECRMFVSDERFAVQRHAREGAVEWFDDLGCLLSKHEAQVEPEAVFAHDFATGEWVRGDRGHAVQVPGLDSPMGYGWTVHATEPAARAAASAAGAEPVRLSELLRRGRPAQPQSFTEAPAPTNPGEDRR